MRFGRARGVLQARTLGDVAAVLREADSYSRRRGGHVAGFVSYEAAPAFDGAHCVRPADGGEGAAPLAWFALFADAPARLRRLAPAGGDDSYIVGKWRADTARAEYLKNVERIRRRIAAGDVYQVNYTWRLRAKFAGSARAWFAALAAAQPSPWSFFAESGEWAVCSASPECFFSRADGRVTVKPMKGTRAPAPGAARRLAACAKDRAENLMIVDMVRNDLARLPGAADIRAEPLLQVEEYPTVLQMTSTVSCRARGGLWDIFSALFPCASVTGAPKIAAMGVIRELEGAARGVYCGACGRAGGGLARFNVGIRTAWIDKLRGEVCYGAGSGVVADSTGGGEWRECREKTAILSAPAPALLLETMRGEGGTVALLSEHLRRLCASAKTLGFAANRARLRRQILQAAAQHCNRPARLRLTLDAGGKSVVTVSPMPGRARGLRLCLLPAPVLHPQLVLHKSGRRDGYERALARAKEKGFADAALINRRGEITETCIANIAARIGGRLYTPPLSCGLLPGVLRAAMIRAGDISEKILTPADLRSAEAVFRLNALRGMEKAEVVFSG